MSKQVFHSLCIDRYIQNEQRQLERGHLFHVIPPFNALVVVEVSGPINYILNPIFEWLSLVYLFRLNMLLVLLKYKETENYRS